MLIPEQQSRVKRLRFSSSMLYVAGGAIAISVVLFATMVWVAGSVPRLTNENKELNTENLQLKQQIQSLSSKMDYVEGVLARVERFDAKLRAITQLNDPDRHIAIGPVSRKDMLVVQSESRDDTAADPLVNDLVNISDKQEVSPKILEVKLDDLKEEAQRSEDSLRELSELLADQRSLLSSLPSTWPVRGWVTSGFGPRISPWTGERAMHEGLDIAAAPGTIVKAPADGVVVFKGTRGGYGKMLIIDHGYGLETRYGHLQQWFAEVGQKVRRGQKIAAVGNTGRSTGPHLHYEVRINGIPENPRKYILE
ncbi:MAG: peptidoglycan DD-metalloendopeptidase family protein [Deltaproteobacteria bacterium]|nr:peptidoglycan DD-metalloendopeptidase family protein [Deltaproteobacteria bacterium]